MVKIEGGPRVGHSPVGGASGATAATTIDETTTPFQRAPPSQLKTEEAPAQRPVITDESKAFAEGRFRADPRAQQLEQRIQSKEAGHVDGAHADDAFFAGANAGSVGKLPGDRAAASSFKTTKEGIAAIERDFPGVKVVASDKWTPEQLSRVHESLSQLGDGEKKALDGVQIKRESRASADEQEGHDHPIAGVFRPNVESVGGHRKAPPAIVFFDGAFPGASGSKPEDRRATSHVVLHEVGHAVERKAASDVLADKNAATDRRNSAVDADDKALRMNNREGEAWSRTAASERPLKEVADVNAMSRASSQVNAALEKMGAASTPAALKKAEAELGKAVAARDKVLAKMDKDDNSAAADAHSLAGTQDAWIAQRRAVGAANVDVASYGAAEKAAYAVLDVPTTDAFEGKTKGLAAFEKAVGKDKVSEYGAASAENFAEAFAMYRRDPAWLEANHPAAFRFMKKNYP
jgi:hypothetical protein